MTAACLVWIRCLCAAGLRGTIWLCWRTGECGQKKPERNGPGIAEALPHPASPIRFTEGSRSIQSSESVVTAEMQVGDADRHYSSFGGLGPITPLVQSSDPALSVC